MAIKPGAKDCVLKEQIIEDEVTGITFLFTAHEDGSGFRMSIYGDCLEFGNRDFVFKNGELVGTGTALGHCPTPTWIQEITPEGKSDEP